MGRHSTRAARSCRSGGLAEGKNPNMGFMVDHLMNYGDSAREGLPVYSLGGGKGYVWIARFGARGREGALRFLAADPSQMKLGTAEAPEVAPAYSPPPETGRASFIRSGCQSRISRDGTRGRRLCCSRAAQWGD